MASRKNIYKARRRQAKQQLAQQAAYAALPKSMQEVAAHTGLRVTPCSDGESYNLLSPGGVVLMRLFATGLLVTGVDLQDGSVLQGLSREDVQARRRLQRLQVERASGRIDAES